MLFLWRLDTRSSGRMKSSAVVGRPGYKNTSSCSWGIPETCSGGTSRRPQQHPRWNLKFGLKLSDFQMPSSHWITLSGYCHQSKVKRKEKSRISTRKTLNICDCCINTAHRNEIVMQWKVRVTDFGCGEDLRRTETWCTCDRAVCTTRPTSSLHSGMSGLCSSRAGEKDSSSDLKNSAMGVKELCYDSLWIPPWLISCAVLSFFICQHAPRC